jgi:hypothetical protein
VLFFKTEAEEAVSDQKPALTDQEPQELNLPALDAYLTDILTIQLENPDDNSRKCADEAKIMIKG